MQRRTDHEAEYHQWSETALDSPTEFEAERKSSFETDFEAEPETIFEAVFETSLEASFGDWTTDDWDVLNCPVDDWYDWGTTVGYDWDVLRLVRLGRPELSRWDFTPVHQYKSVHVRHPRFLYFDSSLVRCANKQISAA